MRPADDAHWGQNATCPNMSHQHYDEDGGMYIEAMRDLKFIAGNAALQLLRGPMMSNMVKQGLIKQGQFYLSKLSEAQLRERMFFGAAIPCVRALNDRKSEDVIDRAGMCPPLAKAVNALRDAFHARMSKLTKTELRQMEASELTERLSALKVRAFDGEALRGELHGASAIELAWPAKAPLPKEGEVLPWWAQPMPEAPVPEIEPMAECPA